ncbi:MFS transporter [Primorskyibacter sp. S187A]|uniref:MFS transporter n=1 Tax=Primorskyibacter sp. S187A TaxID=3415130 RepID=UPI003C79F08E
MSDLAQSGEARETQAPQDDPSSEATAFHDGFCDPARRKRVLWAAILASSLGFIDGSVVSIALPAMRETLGASLGQAIWFSSAYLLTLTALILTGGALGDRFGLGRVFGGGITLFVLASMACAAAPSAESLIAARAIQGIGAAFMVPGSLAVLNRAFPKEERGAAIGFWAGISALTTALGPIIGGLALTFGGPEMWRAVFAVNLPFGGLALWLLFSALKRDDSRSRAPVDLPGVLTATAALLLMAWSLSGAEHDGTVHGLGLVAGCALLGLFILIEKRSAHPMVPLSLFANRTFAMTNLYSLVIYGALAAVFFFLPMVLIALWETTEIITAAMFAPLSVFIAALSGRAGKWAGKIGPRPFLALGAASIAIGYVLLWWAAPAQALWSGAFVAMCFIGLGMALLVAPLSTAIMASVPEASGGTASGVNNAISRMASMMGIASFGALAAVMYHRAGGALSFAAAGGDELHIAQSTMAFQTIMLTAAALAALACLTALLALPGKATARI